MSHFKFWIGKIKFKSQKSKVVDEDQQNGTTDHLRRGSYSVLRANRSNYPQFHSEYLSIYLGVYNTCVRVSRGCFRLERAAYGNPFAHFQLDVLLQIVGNWNGGKRQVIRLIVLSTANTQEQKGNVRARQPGNGIEFDSFWDPPFSVVMSLMRIAGLADFFFLFKSILLPHRLKMATMSWYPPSFFLSSSPEINSNPITYLIF